MKFELASMGLCAVSVINFLSFPTRGAKKRADETEDGSPPNHPVSFQRFFAGAKTGEAHRNSSEGSPKNPLEACHVEAMGKR